MNRQTLVMPSFLRRFAILCVLVPAMSQPGGAFFSLNVTPVNVSFGSLDVDSLSPMRTVDFQVQSDLGVAWDITLQANPLMNADGHTTFPNSNFRYRFLSDSPGGEVPAYPLQAAVPTGTATIYTGGATECASAPCTIAVGLDLVTAPAQKSGVYTTAMTVTLVSKD